MATTDILGLFMSPEQYQAQQLAQQQAAEQQSALGFAGLNPRQQAVYGTFLGAQQLGRGLGGLLGVQDPQLQRIRQRQEIMQSINPADMKSLEAGILRASQMGDQELALSLTEFMRKQGSEMALAQQRKAAAERERTQALPAGVQEAELIGTLTEQLQKTTDSDQRAIIQAKIKRLEKNLTKADELEDLFAAEKEAIADAQSKAAPSQAVGLNGLPLPMQPTVNVDNDPKVKAIRARIKTLTATPIDKQLPEIAKATALADLVSPDRNSSTWKEKYSTELTRLLADKVETPTEAERNATIVARNSGFAPGTPEYQEEFMEAFNRFVAPKDRQPTSTEQLESLYVRLGEAKEKARNINPDPEAVANNPEVIRVGKLIKQLEKTDKPTLSPEAQLVIDMGFEYGTPSYYTALNEYLDSLKTKPAEPERVRINEEVRRRKEEQKKFDPKSAEYKAIQEDIDFLKGDTGKGKVSNFAQLLLDRDIAPGSTEWNNRMDAYITKESTRPETADKEISYGAKREALSAEMFEGKRYKDLTPAQQAKVNKRIESEENVTAATGAPKLYMPGEKGGLKSITDFRNDVFNTIKPFRDTVNAADAAIQNINDSIRTGNFVSFNAARVQLAKALGDSTLSRRDIEQAGGDPSLIGGFFDATSTLFTGTPSEDTQKKIKATLQAIRKVARNKAQNELNTSRDLGIRAGYKEQDLNRAFNVPEITGANPPSNAAPKPKVVPLNALPK